MCGQGFSAHGQKDHAMLTFQIIGGIFALLFLAAAMTGIEGAEGRR